MNGRKECLCPRANHQHGTLGAYQYDKCRCFPCCLNRSRVHAAYSNGEGWYEYDWRPSIGVARRLQALTAIGYTDTQLAEAIRMQRGDVIRLRANKVPTGRVMPTTYDRVAKLYDELWDKPYTGPYSIRTRRLAARKGWLPPLSYDDDAIDNPDTRANDKKSNPEHDEFIDEIAVERACLGDDVPLTRAELTFAIDTLSRMGYSADETGRRLKISDRTVVRYRAREVA